MRILSILLLCALYLPAIATEKEKNCEISQNFEIDTQLYKEAIEDHSLKEVESEKTLESSETKCLKKLKNNNKKRLRQKKSVKISDPQPKDPKKTKKNKSESIYTSKEFSFHVKSHINNIKFNKPYSSSDLGSLFEKGVSLSKLTNSSACPIEVNSNQFVSYVITSGYIRLCEQNLKNYMLSRLCEQNLKI